MKVNMRLGNQLDEGPRLPSSGNSPAPPDGGSVSYRQCRFPPPSMMGSQGPPVPRAARANGRTQRRSPATGDPCNNLHGLARRLRHARAGGGPHVLSDSSPHLATPQRLTEVRVNPTAEAAGPLSRLHHDDPATPRRWRRGGEHNTAHQPQRTVSAAKARKG